VGINKIGKIYFTKEYKNLPQRNSLAYISQIFLSYISYNKTGDNRCEKQEEIEREKMPALEQPARIMGETKNTCRKNSIWVKIEQTRYKYHKSYITGEVNKKGKRWITAGRIYEREECETTCPECENQCMVKK